MTFPHTKPIGRWCETCDLIRLVNDYPGTMVCRCVYPNPYGPILNADMPRMVCAEVRYWRDRRLKGVKV